MLPSSNSILKTESIDAKRHNPARSIPRRGFVAAATATLLGLIAGKSAAQPESPPISAVHIGRRIVTGVDDQGRSRVAKEEPVPANAHTKATQTESLIFWVVRDVPAMVNGPIEPTPDYEFANRAPSHGLAGLLFTWAPGFSYPRHATPTLDFIIILSGQLEMILDTESRILNSGDVVVQRGTAHAWRVVGSDPCTFAGIMIDMKAV